MNGLSADALPLAGELTNKIDDLASHDFEMLICPPFPYLDSVAITLKQSGLVLGAQDCHPSEKGPHTGDVSAPMLIDLSLIHI